MTPNPPLSVRWCPFRVVSPQGMRFSLRFFACDVLDFELNIAAVVPVVDRRVENHRAARARGEGLRFLGQVPADGLQLMAPLPESYLQMLFLATRGAPRAP